MRHAIVGRKAPSFQYRETIYDEERLQLNLCVNIVSCEIETTPLWNVNNLFTVYVLALRSLHKYIFLFSQRKPERTYLLISKLRQHSEAKNRIKIEIGMLDLKLMRKMREKRRLRRRSLMIQSEIKVGLCEGIINLESRIETIKSYYAINLFRFRRNSAWELSDLKFFLSFSRWLRVAT